jgi:hypothetical protein
VRPRWSRKALNTTEYDGGGGRWYKFFCATAILLWMQVRPRWSRRALNTTEYDRCATGGLTKEIDKNSFLVCLIGISFLPPAGLEIMARK